MCPAALARSGLAAVSARVAVGLGLTAGWPHGTLPLCHLHMGETGHRAALPTQQLARGWGQLILHRQRETGAQSDGVKAATSCLARPWQLAQRRASLIKGSTGDDDVGTLIHYIWRGKSA